MITRADLTLEKNTAGAWVVSALVVGYLVSCQYYGYTKKEAADKFIAEIKRQKTEYDRLFGN
jgi:RNase H-fold protein (predicted Holliday junction resolvase)